MKDYFFAQSQEILKNINPSQNLSIVFHLLLLLQLLYFQQFTTKMKSYGLVINDSLQPNQPYHTFSQNNQNQINFPKISNPLQTNNTQSYSTVIQQAVTTQDKPLLKEIIAECDAKLIKNTISAINMTKISHFFSLLQQFMYEDSEHNAEYSAWMGEIMNQHLGIILSNKDNKNIVLRLRKYLQQKISHRSNLLQLKEKLRQKKVLQRKQFTAKFTYVQNMNQEMIPDENKMDFEQLLQDEDLIDEFDQ